MADEAHPSGHPTEDLLPRPPEPADASDVAVPVDSRSWLDRHLWQIQPVRDVGVFFAVLGLLYLARAASVVTVPLLLALLAAYLFEPVVKWLMRFDWMSRRRAVVAIILGVVVFVITPAVLGVAMGIAELNSLRVSLAENTTAVLDSIEDPTNEARYEAIPEGPWREIRDYAVNARGDEVTAEIEAAVRWAMDNAEEITKQVVAIGGGTLVALFGFMLTVGALGFMLFLTLFFFYFVSSGWPKVVGFGRSLLPTEHAERITELVSEMDKAIAGFVRGRLTIAFIQAIVFSVLYAVIGVPAPFVVGSLVAILSIVPYLALIGLPVSIALLFLQDYESFRGSIWWIVIAPLVVYNIGQALDDYVLTPMIQGKETGLDIPTILFATLAGGALLGVVGMLVAIPLAACVKILIREVVWPRYVSWREGRDPDFLPLDRV